MKAPGSALFTSAEAYRARPPEKRPALAIFRGVDDLEELGELALETRDCTLVLDEIDRAFAGKQWTAPSVRRIVHEGRHFRVNLLGGCRRIADIGEDLVGQADLVAVFKHSAKAVHDIARLERSLGAPYAAFARRAEFGQYVIFDDSED